jgi:hypothetical protein
MYLYVCIHACMYTYVCVCKIPTSPSAAVYDVYICIYTYIHTHTHKHTSYTATAYDIYICMYVYVPTEGNMGTKHTYTHICVHIYIYIYIYRTQLQRLFLDNCQYLNIIRFCSFFSGNWQDDDDQKMQSEYRS